MQQSEKTSHSKEDQNSKRMLQMKRVMMTSRYFPDHTCRKWKIGRTQSLFCILTKLLVHATFRQYNLQYRNRQFHLQLNMLDWHTDDKVDPLHAMKGYTGSRGTAPLILNLGTRWRGVTLIS
jgi:hypothetical protein